MPDTDIRATFILRLWRERGAPPGEWRGELTHVQTARLERFGDRAALFAFVETELAALEGTVVTPTEELP